MTPVFWILAAMPALLAQGPASTGPAVQLRVAVYTYGADGSVRGSAGGTIGESPDSPSLTWVASSSMSCGMGAGVLPARQDAIVWKSSGRIVSHIGDAYTIALDVRRTSGTMSEPPVGQKTVAIGEHVLLDEVPSVPGPCGGRTARLEASVELARPPGVGAVGVGGRGGASGGIGNAGSGVGAGPRMTIDAPPATFINNSLDHLGDRPTESSLLEGTGPTAAGGSPVRVELYSVQASYRAELWLVHTAPDGTQQTEAEVGHVDDVGASFRFAVLPIRLPDGPTLVFVGVNLRPMVTESGQPVLRAEIARVVQGVQESSEGASSRAVSMPGPGDVVSFELPQSLASLAGHRFELRVRLTPIG